MPTRRLTMLKLDFTSKSICQHLRYAELKFLVYYNKQQVLWIDERSANKYNNYSSASNYDKNGFIDLPGIF